MNQDITSPQAGEIRVVACPHPFSSARIEQKVLEGPTIRQIMDTMTPRGVHLHARVFIDDRMIQETEWEYAVPRAGQYVSIRVIPTGGGGGGQKDALRLVSIIAIVAATAWVSAGASGLMIGMFAGGTVGAAVASAAVGIGLSLAMNANIPAPLPRRSVPRPLPARALEEAA